MSSPKSSSRRTSAGLRSKRRRPASPSHAPSRIAAAVTAVAILALPWAVVFGLVGGEPWGVVPFLVDVAALAVVAWRLWSPLVVLTVCVLSLASAVVFWMITVAGGTCGGRDLAGVLEWAGGLALGLPIAIWGVRRGRWAFVAVPAAWVAAACWFVLVAHLVPGGAGGCFE